MSENKKEKAAIAGFVFENRAEAEQGAKEAEGVKFIKSRTDMENPEMVFDIYNKMIQEKLFETAVGFAYLKELQEYLKANPFIKDEDIRPIPISHPTLEESFRRRTRHAADKPKETKNVIQPVNVNYKTRYRAMRALSIVFGICVIAMFAITATTDNTTILNYEQEIINKYEEWESELSERERNIREREAELGITTE